MLAQTSGGLVTELVDLSPLSLFEIRHSDDALLAESIGEVMSKVATGTCGDAIQGQRD
jgi:hypothetical protein